MCKKIHPIAKRDNQTVKYTLNYFLTGYMACLYTVGLAIIRLVQYAIPMQARNLYQDVLKMWAGP